MAARLCGPGLVCAAVTAGLYIGHQTRSSVLIAWPLWIAVWVGLAVAMPYDYARRVAERSALRPTRRRWARVMQGLAVGVNGIGAVAAMVLMRRLG
jgi:hypothetical protein